MKNHSVFGYMKEIKLRELFAYENVVNEKTNKAKVLCWNNKTMLIAENNSVELLQEELCFDDIIKGVASGDSDCITLLLFSAMTCADSSFTIEDFIEYFDENDIASYNEAVIDGVFNYMPNSQLQEEIKELNSMLGQGSESTEDDSDIWAFNYFFCKKHLAMSDDDFLNTTWRAISILQRELMKQTPEYQKNKVVSAEFVDI